MADGIPWNMISAVVTALEVALAIVIQTHRWRAESKGDSRKAVRQPFDFGLTPSSTAVERIQIRTANVVLVCAILASLGWSVLAWARTFPDIATFANAVAVFLFGAGLILNALKLYDVARFGLMIVAGGQIVFVAWTLSPEDWGIEVFLIVYAVGPLLLFNRKQAYRLMAAFGIVGIVLGAAVLRIFVTSPIATDWPPNQLRLGFYVATATTALLLGIALYYYINLSLKKDEQIEDLLQKGKQGLRHALPQPIIDRTAQPATHGDNGNAGACMLVVDIGGLDSDETGLAPIHRIEMLESMFSILDEVAERQGIETFKTFGTLYLAGSGVLNTAPTHIAKVADAALEMRQAVHEFAKFQGVPIDLRMAMCTGRTISLATKSDTPPHQYLWANTETIAAHLDLDDSKDRIQVSEVAYTALCKDFDFKDGPELPREDGPPLKTFYLTSRRPGTVPAD